MIQFSDCPKGLHTDVVFCNKQQSSLHSTVIQIDPNNIQSLSKAIYQKI